MEQTAIDWLYDQIDSKGKCIYDVLDQARALHRKQIEQAHIDGGKNQRTAVKYYEETFNPQTKK